MPVLYKLVHVTVTHSASGQTVLGLSSLTPRQWTQGQRWGVRLHPCPRKPHDLVWDTEMSSNSCNTSHTINLMTFHIRWIKRLCKEREEYVCGEERRQKLIEGVELAGFYQVKMESKKKRMNKGLGARKHRTYAGDWYSLGVSLWG